MGLVDLKINEWFSNGFGREEIKIKMSDFIYNLQGLFSLISTLLPHLFQQQKTPPNLNRR